MKNFLFLFFCILFLSCHNGKQYHADQTLSKDEQESFKSDIVRFAGRLAKRATHETKFDSTFHDAYSDMAKSMSLDKYYVNPKDGYTYFEVSRIAPSVHERYVATGGRLKKDDKDTIVDYEEIYRTWKMEKSDLATKTKVYFDYMVNGKDLSEFYTKNIGNTENIEFPDEQTFFDKEKRRWEMKISESL